MPRPEATGGARSAGVNLANPLLVWSGVWLSVLALVQLQLTTQMYPVNQATLLLVLANIVTFALWLVPITLYYRLRAAPPTPTVHLQDLDLLRRIARRALVLWAAGFVAELILFRGAPLLWLLRGDVGRGYQDFGIPSVQGFLQAIFLFCLTAVFIDWQARRRRADLLLLLALLAWPILLLSRALLLWEMLEIAAIYVTLHTVRWRHLAIVLLGTLVAVMLIGWVGDYRVPEGGAALQAVVSERARPAFKVLPSGFLWVYVYATSPINNIIAVIDHFRPLYRIYYSAVQLVPGAVRESFFPLRGDSRYALGLVASEFNTGTIYRNYLADWGIAGAIAVVALFQTFITYFYVAARRRLLWGVLGFAVFYPGIVLSGFSDQIAYLPALAQLAIVLYFRAATRAARTLTERTPA